MIDFSASLRAHDQLKRDTLVAEHFERSISPLKPANDAVILDSTNLDVEEVVNKILQRFQNCV